MQATISNQQLHIKWPPVTNAAEYAVYLDDATDKNSHNAALVVEQTEKTEVFLALPDVYLINIKIVALDKNSNQIGTVGTQDIVNSEYEQDIVNSEYEQAINQAVAAPTIVAAKLDGANLELQIESPEKITTTVVKQSTCLDDTCPVNVYFVKDTADSFSVRAIPSDGKIYVSAFNIAANGLASPNSEIVTVDVPESSRVSLANSQATTLTSQPVISYLPVLGPALIIGVIILTISLVATKWYYQRQRSQ